MAAWSSRRTSTGDFGVIAQLGFFPREAGFDAVELSRHAPAGSPATDGYAALRAADRALLGQATTSRRGLRRLRVRAGGADFRELVLALKHREGRVLADALTCHCMS